jgi:tryptophan 2,3-dioxygenase
MNPPRTYGDYLALDEILGAQRPASGKGDWQTASHDELLFIVVHQAYELWFKAMIFEIDDVLKILSHGTVAEAQVALVVHRFKRVNEILKLILEQIRVLETMSPLDFLEFRSQLGGYSGFQSYQFRLLEAKLGLRRKDRLTYGDRQYYCDLDEAHQRQLREAESQLNLFDALDAWLSRTPFLEMKGFRFLDAYKEAADKIAAAERAAVDREKGLSEQERQRRLARVAGNAQVFASVTDTKQHEEYRTAGQRRLSYRGMLGALFINLYRDEPILHLPYQLLVGVTEVDENLTLWRYRHAQMVHRMLGRKIGTGGSPGYDYLKETVERHKIFQDFFDLSTLLLPRSELPPLPENFKQSLGFSFDVNDKVTSS